MGIILVSVSGIGLAAESEGHCGYEYVATSDRNETSVMEVWERLNTPNTANATDAPTTIKKHYCTPFTATDLATGLLALIGGSLMWSISSSKLFMSAVAYYFVSRWSLSLQYNFFPAQG